MLYKENLIKRQKLKQSKDNRIRIFNLIKRNDDVLKKDYDFDKEGLN
jgi:hypothetical protein